MTAAALLLASIMVATPVADTVEITTPVVTSDADHMFSMVSGEVSSVGAAQVRELDKLTDEAIQIVSDRHLDSSNELTKLLAQAEDVHSTQHAQEIIEQLTDALDPYRATVITEGNGQVTATGWTHPLPGAKLSSSYGPRATIMTPAGPTGAFHHGIDFSAPEGTAIRAAYDGVVSYVGYGYGTYGLTGNSVVIDHANGVQTSYNHIRHGGTLVSRGQEVLAGQIIAEVGSTGFSTAPHLHFSTWVNGQHTDPQPFMSERGVVVDK